MPNPTSIKPSAIAAPAATAIEIARPTSPRPTGSAAPVGAGQEQPTFTAHDTLARGAGDPRAELCIPVEHPPRRCQGGRGEAREPEERQETRRRGLGRRARLAHARHLDRGRQRPPQQSVRRDQAGSTSTARP